MATLTPQMPTVSTPITPTYTAVSAADKFAANPGTTYLLHYKNGATPGTATLWVLSQSTTAPAGTLLPVTVPSGATSWNDAQISATLGASTERDIVLDKSIIAQFIDSTGFVNLKHNGTLTTITVAIYGPF